MKVKRFNKRFQTRFRMGALFVFGLFSCILLDFVLNKFSENFEFGTINWGFSGVWGNVLSCAS